MIETDLQFGRGEITSEEIGKRFKIDYRKLVTETFGHTLSFFDNPRRHIGSQALYLAEEMVGKDMIFVSYLVPNGQTTTHKHQEPIREKYFQLAGFSRLLLGNEFHDLETGYGLTVPSDVFHKLTTKNNPSLVLIVMENAISVPKDKLHIPVGF